MSLTLPELCDKLKDVDEITLLERLDITSEEIVNRFIDIIEERFDILEEEETIDIEEDIE